jgi:hypothetical protein
MMEQMYNCPNCNSPVAYGQSSCEYCGTPLTWGDDQSSTFDTTDQQQSEYYDQQPYTCPSCGANVMFGDPSCNNCGNPFYWEEQQSQYPEYNEPQYTNPPPQQFRQQYLNQPPMPPPYGQNMQNNSGRGRNHMPPNFYGKNAPKKKQSLTGLALAIAAVLVLVVGAIWMLTNNGGSSSGPTVSTRTQVAEATLPADSSPKINSFVSSPPEIQSGQSTTLTWSILGATTVTIDPEIGAVSGVGTKSVSPTVTTDYTISATNGNGTTTQKTTITVNPVKPVISSFALNPNVITAGESATLSWSVTGATRVTINQGVGDVALTGSKQVTSTSSVTYVLTAINTAGTVTQSVNLSVASKTTPVISGFTASPSSITAGGSSVLTWVVTGATTITIESIGDVTTLASANVTPTATTTYTMYAVNSAGTTTKTVTVSIGSLGIDYFTANPTTITSGGISTLSWNVIGATSVSISPSIGTVSSLGTTTVSPTTSTAYTLTASNGASTVTRSVPITVSSSNTSSTAPVITSFTVSAPSLSIAPATAITVPSNTSVHFQFVSPTYNITSASISPDVGIMSFSYADFTVTTTSQPTTTYTLTLTNSSGSTTATVTVTVQ